MKNMKHYEINKANKTNEINKANEAKEKNEASEANNDKSFEFHKEYEVLCYEFLAADNQGTPIYLSLNDIK